jgi:hypothetical protein
MYVMLYQYVDGAQIVLIAIPAGYLLGLRARKLMKGI